MVRSARRRPQARLVRVSRTLAAVGVLTLASTRAGAEQGAGTLADPIRVDALPYFVAGTTVGAPSQVIDNYSCAPELDESGPELLYRFELPARARVTAWLEGDSDVVDNDVHILADLELDGATATGCLARAHTIAEAELEAGTYYIAVDVYNGPEQVGDFVLRLYAVGDAWFEFPIARGVTWRARRYAELAGQPQVVNSLLVDREEEGVWLDVVDPGDCLTVAETALALDPAPVAAINSSFFSFDTCTSVSFMKSGGELLATNAGAVARGAFGITPADEVVMGLVDPGADWPEVELGQGGIPTLALAGALRDEDDYASEGITSPSFIGPNPRTLIGARADGAVVMATVDGRRPSAGGLALPELGAWAVAELSASSVLNLDGGGSTTLWIAGMTPNGVVNYPSDAGMIETMDHAGARAVVGAVLVYGEPFNHPPRFQSEPVVQASAGEPYSYDADAIDLNVHDTISYELAAGPEGMQVDAVTGLVSYAPTVMDPPALEVMVVARDQQGLASEQSYTLAIAGGMGPGESDSETDSDTDSDTADAGTETDADSGSTGDTSGADSDDGGAGTGPAGGAGDDAGTDSDGGATDDPVEGCGCGASGGAPRSGLAWLIGLVGLAGRRRLSRGS